MNWRHGILHAGSDHEIFLPRSLLQHHPLHAHIILAWPQSRSASMVTHDTGICPPTPCAIFANNRAVMLARDKGFAHGRGSWVKQDARCRHTAINGPHGSLTVNPIGDKHLGQRQLGRCAGSKGCFLRLWFLFCTRLVQAQKLMLGKKAVVFSKARKPDWPQAAAKRAPQKKKTVAVYLSCICFTRGPQSSPRHWLCAPRLLDLVRLHLAPQDPRKVRTVGQVAIVQDPDRG